MSVRKRFGTGIVLIVIAAAAAFGGKPAYRWWQRSRRAAWAAQCRAARDSERWVDLQTMADRWAARDPEVADPWLFLAEAAQGRHDWPAAAAALVRIPDTDPKAPAALLALAQIEFGALNRPLVGEAVCQRLLTLQPRAAPAHQRLIQFYAISVQREKLLRQIRFAIDQRCEPPEAYVYLLLLDTLRMSNGVELNEHWLKAHPNDELFVVGRAIQFPEPHDPIVAPSAPLDVDRKARAGKLKLVETLLEKYPANLELMAYEIERCTTLGEVNRVAQMLSHAPEAAERDSRFWRFKGWVHEMLDELPAAETAYKQALEIHPLDWNAWNRLATVCRRRQDVREVERLTALVEQSRALRIEIRKLPAAELVTPEILADLASYARKCGAGWVADALDSRVGRPDRWHEPIAPAECD